MSAVTTTSKKLNMKWMTDADTSVNLSINDPLDDLDGETVDSSMNVILAQNVLQDGKGNNASVAVSASIVETTVTETPLF